MSKYEKMLQVLPPLLEKLWPGNYSFSNFYHVKSGMFQINVIPNGYNQEFVCLTAEGKTLDEATDKLFEKFRVKMNKHFEDERKVIKQANIRMEHVEAMVRSIEVSLEENGYEAAIQAEN